MIHAVCDFCGKEMTRHGYFISLTPFQNFGRYHTDTEPFGTADKPKGFCMCSECLEKHGLPNPYSNYEKITEQELGYEKYLDNYTDQDTMDDICREIRGGEKK